MKNITLTCLLLLLLSQSCKKDKSQFPICESCNFTCLDINDSEIISNNCIENWNCSFNVESQSKVDLDQPKGISSGDKIVFQMNNNTEGSPDIADDEYTNILVFEIDESLEIFSVEDDELNDLRVHFKRVCFCPEVIFETVTSGCIQGEKQADGSWFVQGNLSVPLYSSNIDLNFDAEFGN